MPIKAVNYSEEMILVVDDEDYIRKPIVEMLRHMGFRVDSATHAKAALKELNEKPYTLLLTDIRMPYMDGLELTRRVRNDFPHIISIAMTGYSKEYDYVDTLKAGAVDFISKPFGIEELEAKIVRALIERNMKKELIKLKVIQESEQLDMFKMSSHDLRGIKSRHRGQEVLGNLEVVEEYKVLLAAVGHNLRGEFLIIENSIKAIRDLAPNLPELREEREIIERSIHHSQLDLTRVLAYLDLTKPLIHKVNILEVLRRTESLIKPRLQRNIDLKVKIPQESKAMVLLTNPEILMLALRELIKNATNAMSNKGGTISMQVEQANDCISISVKDNGPGIPREMEKKLFKERVRSKRGLGVGLYLCEKTITSLGGTLRLKSSKKKGTVVTISLPIRKQSEM